MKIFRVWRCCFNTQPPEGGCGLSFRTKIFVVTVSTHSHPKVAAQLEPLSIHLIFKFQHTATRRWLRFMTPLWGFLRGVSTHSHPKVAAGVCLQRGERYCVSTHSHPKVAAYYTYRRYSFSKVSTHSHPKVAASFLC